MNLYHAHMGVNGIDPKGNFVFLPFLAYALILTAVDSIIGTSVDAYQGKELTTSGQLKRVGKSFVLNSLTAGFAGYAQAAKWGTKATYGASILFDTSVGTAYDTAIEGQKFNTALGINLFGSVLGNSIALGATKVFGRSAGRGPNNSGSSAELYRRTHNLGEFSELKVPMQMRYVKLAAKEARIDLKGIKITIDRSPANVNLPFFGSTSANGKNITLFPKAFKNTKELIKTLGHERTHSFQKSLYGNKPSLLMQFKKAAYAIEDTFYNFYLKNKSGKLKKFDKGRL